MNDFLLSLPAETYTSWMVVILISIFSLFVYRSSKKVDPLKKPKGIMLIAEWIVFTIERLVKTNMGRHFNFMTPYFLSITLYIFIGFLFGLTGLSSLVE